MDTIDFGSIPVELKELPNWVCWTVEDRNNKPTKIPLNPSTRTNARSDDPSTWGAFDCAVQEYLNCENGGIEGIGFMLSNGFLGVDLDKCRNPENGKIESWAIEIVDKLKSYTEVTPSKTGLHVWIKGKLPPQGRRRGSIEMYDGGRYFTVTGQHLEGTPLEIHKRQEEIEAVHAEVFGNGQKMFPTGNKSSSESSSPISNTYLLKKALEATNGDKFRKLWEGDFSEYPSQSEADLALSLLLAFWTRKNPVRMGSLFRASKLMRPKWDEKHFSNGQTYGAHTIAAAIEQTTEVYDPRKTAEDKTSPCAAKPEFSYRTLNLPSSLEISQMQIAVDWVVENLIPQESITLLHSIGGVGKTYLMYGIGQAVADGVPFFDLNVMKIPVYYVDFENPLPEIVDRMKKIGGSENLRIWHLGHDPLPVRFDTDEWEIYKSFPPGLFIIDSLRSSHLLEENSSKDAAFIMSRHKEIRALGNTIVLIHHENKLGGYRGSTAWFDLSDHILKFSRVEKIGSDKKVEEDNFDLPIRLGLGGKSRFSSAMNFKPMYFRFEEKRLCRAEDPDEETLNKMAGFLNPAYPPNQSEFRELIKKNMSLGRVSFDRLLKKGERLNYWYSKRSRTANKLEYHRGTGHRF